MITDPKIEHSSPVLLLLGTTVKANDHDFTPCHVERAYKYSDIASLGVIFMPCVVILTLKVVIRTKWDMEDTKWKVWL